MRSNSQFVFFLCYSYIGFFMQRIPQYERVCDSVPDELRKIWSEYSIGSVFSAAGRILGNTSNSMECRQLGTWTGNNIRAPSWKNEWNRKYHSESKNLKVMMLACEKREFRNRVDEGLTLSCYGFHQVYKY